MTKITIWLGVLLFAVMPLSRAEAEELRRSDSIAVLRLLVEAGAGDAGLSERLREAAVRRLSRMGEVVREPGKLPAGCADDPRCLQRELKGRVDRLLDGAVRAQGEPRSYVVDLRLFVVAAGKDRRRVEVPCEDCDEAALVEVVADAVGQLCDAPVVVAAAPRAVVAPPPERLRPTSEPLYWRPWRVALTSIFGSALLGGLVIVPLWRYDVQRNLDEEAKTLGEKVYPKATTPPFKATQLDGSYYAGFAVPAAAAVGLVITLTIPSSRSK